MQAMRNGQMSIAEKMKKVYGTEEDIYEALEAKGLAPYVKVDLEIPGCQKATVDGLWETHVGHPVGLQCYRRAQKGQRQRRTDVTGSNKLRDRGRG